MFKSWSGLALARESSYILIWLRVLTFDLNGKTFPKGLQVPLLQLAEHFLGERGINFNH